MPASRARSDGVLSQGFEPGPDSALGKQWSHDYPIDVPATPTLLAGPAAKKLSAGANDRQLERK